MYNDYNYYAQENSIAVLALSILLIVAMWRIFTKCGEPGWKAIIPFYNVYTLTKVTTGGGFKMFFMFIPLIGWFFYPYLCYKTAQSFGRGMGFTLGLFFFPYIFYMILGFSKAQYLGPNGFGDYQTFSGSYSAPQSFDFAERSTTTNVDVVDFTDTNAVEVEFDTTDN